jgi:N-acetylglutamate synthase-like GNAT family acetyltransferase
MQGNKQGIEKNRSGAVGFGAHRHLNALHGNGRCGRARSATDSDRDRDEDDDDGGHAVRHGSFRKLRRFHAVILWRLTAARRLAARQALRPAGKYRPIPIDMSRQFLSPRGGRGSPRHGGCRPRGDLGSGARRRSQVGHKLPCSSRKRLFEREPRSSYNVTRLVPMIDGSTHSIRIARPSDSDAVSALLEASYSTLLAARYDHEMLSRALPLMTRANPTLLASGTYYVAESDQGNLVGCGGWTTARPGGGEIIEGEAHIRHFATHPEWVGRGIGTSLLARCFSDARPLGIRKLHCFPH